MDVPAEAVAWQVQRVVARGAPQLLYIDEGTPLFLPITAGIEELRGAVEAEGRYQLAAVNAQRPGNDH